MSHGNQLKMLTICIASVGLISSGCTGNQQIDSWDPPNIVVLIADDLASNEIGCYGGVNAKTPHIDQLATDGLKFTNIFASAAMCVPIRASLYTGLFPARHGAYQNHKPSFSDQESIVHYLAELGYRVGLTGKNHTRPRSVYPFEIIPGFEPSAVAQTADVFMDDIKEFVQRSEDPFCLFVGSTHPHAPWTVGDPTAFDPDKLVLPPHWVDNEETREIFTKYLAEVVALDDEMGALIKMLEETGKTDNTMVIFLGEQGPLFPGGKWTCWEHGLSSSMVIKWPGYIKPGSVTEAIVQYEDITPLFIELAGGETREYLDGTSFLPVIFGKEDSHRTYAYGIHNNIPEGSQYAIRSIRNDRYKLILNLNHQDTCYVRHLENYDRPDPVWYYWRRDAAIDEHAAEMVSRFLLRPEMELYDLKQDRWELNNLAGSEELTPIIAELRKELLAWMESQNDHGAAMDVSRSDE